MSAPALKRSLVDIALEQIRQRIDDGTWPLGQRLPPEPELAEIIGISRNTVREAVRVLTFSGVLEVRQGDGTYVRACADPLSTMQALARSSVEQALEARGMIEIEASRLAALRRTEADLIACAKPWRPPPHAPATKTCRTTSTTTWCSTSGWWTAPTTRC